MLHVIARHEEYFDGIKASWTYFEVGHGKGPCDGAGGTAKRMTDLAIKRGTTIRCAREFVEWGESEQRYMQYVYVTPEKIAATAQEFNITNIKPFKGIMDLHAVIPVKPGVVAVRKTSCFGDCCYSSSGVCTPSCEGWQVRDVVKTGR
jgi:hypothetical protein